MRKVGPGIGAWGIVTLRTAVGMSAWGLCETDLLLKEVLEGRDQDRYWPSGKLGLVIIDGPAEAFPENLGVKLSTSNICQTQRGKHQSSTAPNH